MTPDFKHLVLLIGTNPLPNFVVADFFLRSGINLEKIWLIYSEKNKLQAGTSTLADNLEKLLHQKWHKKATNLQFPLQRVSLSDVGDGERIRWEVREKMLQDETWRGDTLFHLNYTGGTKAMATHVYLELEKNAQGDQHPFSYLDANNFRLLLDGKGIFPDATDLRKTVNLSFAELIALHGFRRKNQDKEFDVSEVEKKFLEFLHKDKYDTNGHYLEQYLYIKIKERFAEQFHNNDIVLNWEIKKPSWNTYFELDIVIMQGYQLTGISCTITGKNGGKGKVKLKGMEIIHRCRQIGGDEAKVIIVSGLNRKSTRQLQEELEYETRGTRKNILALGLAELQKEELYLKKIKQFVIS